MLIFQGSLSKLLFTCTSGSENNQTWDQVRFAKTGNAKTGNKAYAIYHFLLSDLCRVRETYIFSS